MAPAVMLVEPVLEVTATQESCRLDMQRELVELRPFPSLSEENTTQRQPGHLAPIGR